MMTSTTQETVVSCLCGKHQHTYALPTSTERLDYFICHCNSCRRASGGSLYQGAIVWPYPLTHASESSPPPEDPKTLLQQYDFGPILDYWYCETCSTKMYWQYKRQGSELEVFPGLLDESLIESGVPKLSCVSQVFVADTLDGGLSSCFFGFDGEIGERHQENTTSAPFVAQETHKHSITPPTVVDGECHCGKTTLKLSSHRNGKYPVELDTSKESRLLNSVDLSVWAKVERENVISINNMPLNILEALRSNSKDGQIGSLSVYATESTTIYFCNGCSASILIQPRQSNTSETLKIGAGLLKSVSGARKEDILDWRSVKPIELKFHNIRVDPQKF